jgi:hypothetical protein
MKVKMKVPLTIMRMHVNMLSWIFSQCEIQKTRSQRDDHQGNAEFEKISEAFGNGDTQNDDEKARSEERSRVTHAPECSHSGSPQNRPPFADDGGDSGKVVRFGGVFQSKRKPKAQGQQDRILHRDGNLYRSCLLRTRRKLNSTMATVVRTAFRLSRNMT